MPLVLYRRHSKDCKHYGRSRRDARSQRCRCSLYVQGSLGMEYVRRALDLTSWEAATELVREWGAAGRIAPPRPPAIDASIEQPSPSSVSPQEGHEPAIGRKSISDAVKEYLDDCKARNLTPPTIGKYSTLLVRQLLPHCQRAQLHDLPELNVGALRTFRNGWTFAPITSVKKLECLRGFLSFCVASGWLFNNPAKALKPPRVRPQPTLPFEDADVERLIEACDEWSRRWGGDAKEPRALFLTLRYSGLRISDAVALKKNRVRGDKIFLYQQKTGEPVFVPVPPSVIAALKDLHASGEYFFWSGNGKLKSALEAWRRTLLTTAEIADVDDARFHRFRDSFAVDLLLKDVPIETVSVLLGHASVKVTEKHYRPWVRRLQLKLEDAVRQTWGMAAAS